MLLGMIDRGHASESLRRDVVAITRNSPLVEVRDLFERFIPEEERVKRLGDVVDRAAILALARRPRARASDLHQPMPPLSARPATRRATWARPSART